MWMPRRPNARRRKKQAKQEEAPSDSDDQWFSTVPKALLCRCGSADPWQGSWSWWRQGRQGSWFHHRPAAKGEGGSQGEGGPKERASSGGDKHIAEAGGGGGAGSASASSGGWRCRANTARKAAAAESCVKVAQDFLASFESGEDLRRLRPDEYMKIHKKLLGRKEDEGFAKLFRDASGAMSIEGLDLA